ncbi:MAG: hypothetical protein KME45_28935 [Stenomitos rutilans HA7619-LM2]|jgi:hypothetical protein|nr:hypothetical protein [Stenomitos rutilans HA7619-LM2]
MENLAYLYVLAEEAALLETDERRNTTHTQNHWADSHRSPQANMQPLEGGKAVLEGDRGQPAYPTFYL